LSGGFPANKSRGPGPPSPLAATLALIFIVIASGCAHRRRPPVTVTRPTPVPSAPRTRPSAPTTPAPGPKTAPIFQGETGIASWYGNPFHGRRTANGEVYNMYEMTAAHRTLPFNTMVRVHNLENGRDVEVRITDRGPFVEGRIIDLSFASAQAMGMSGTALVRLEILGATSPGGAEPEPGFFAVQVGAFQDRSNAEWLKQSIAQRFGPVDIQTFDRGDAVFYRVRVGRESTEDKADDLARQLREAGFAIETFVVRLD
jgi:rare lipoprotein A